MAAAQALLASLDEAWLLLVDRADEVEDVSGLWPPGQYGDILYTSRNPMLKTFSPDAVCKVPELEEDKAIKLLLDTACLRPPSDKVMQLASEIIMEFGLLALAVDQACTYMAVCKSCIYDFLDTFKYYRARLLRRDTCMGAASYKRAMYAPWDMSYAAILQRVRKVFHGHQVARHAICLLMMLAYFHHEDVIKEMFM
jgi:hypothetical protein